MADATIVGTRTCSKCRCTKPLTEFHQNAGYCKPCAKEYQADRRRKGISRRNSTGKKRLRGDALAQYIAAGLKACCRCGTIKPFDAFYQLAKSADGRASACIECLKAASKTPERRAASRINSAKWAAANPDAARATRARTRAKHRDKLRAELKGWRASNRDHIREYDKSRREIITAQRRDRYAADPEPHRRRASNWAKAHPEYPRVLKQRRRARKHGAAGTHTLAEERILLEQQHFCCANPHCRVDLRIARKALDHIVSLARGGSNSIDNLQWLCVPCNSRKTTLPVEEWLQRESKRSRLK